MKELFEILLSDLRAGVQQWNRLLGVGLLFALLSHFYVVEPYFRHKFEEDRIRANLSRGINEVDQIAREVNRLEPANQSARQSLVRVQQRIREYPDHLRARLPEIGEIVRNGSSPALQQIAPRRVGDFQMPWDINEFEPGVRWYVEAWFSSLIAELEMGVARAVSSVAVAEDRLPGIEERSEKAIEQLRIHLDGVNPEFWRRYGENGKTDVAEKLQRVVEEFFSPIEKQITDAVERMRAELAGKRAELNDLEHNLQITTQRKQALEARLQALESPLGRLPLGLTDLITLFPLLMAGVILLLTLILRRARRLQRALGGCKLETTPENRAALELCAECWFLPPYRNYLNPLLVLAAVALLLGLMGRAIWLITAGPGKLAFSSTEVEVLRGNALLSIYAISTVMALGALISWLPVLAGGARLKNSTAE